MRKMLGVLFQIFLGFALVSALSAQQTGRVLYVSNHDNSCNGQTPCYNSIQGAVNAAQARDTIQIQAGTYSEQLTISKNDFVGATEADRIIIEADPASSPDSVRVTGSAGPQCTDKFAIRLKQSKFITIRGLTITGTGAQAISLMGGNNANQGIHIEQNRIYGNGNSSCSGGITIARGNPDTLIVNNLIYGNGRNGITFIDADGGPHYIVNNTIYGNQWNGLDVARSHEVYIVNNIINQNGTLSGSTGGRFGIQRESSNSPSPQGIHLLNNLLCGNRLGEINGPILDTTDARNLTPQGIEGQSVSASSACQTPATVFANVNGSDGLANTADDDFRPESSSPVIDRGVDPRALGLNVLFNPILEADYLTYAVRPKPGVRGGSSGFDIGAFEQILPNQAPVANAGPPVTVTSGGVFNLNGTASIDADGDTITFHWSQTLGPSVTLSNPTSGTPAATAPSVTETTLLAFQLTVSDGLASSTANVIITVIKANRPPVIDPIENKTVNVAETLIFSVSGSDPDGDPLTFAVSPQPLPANASFDPATRVFTFTPNQTQAGSLGLSFTVTDGRGGIASETTTVNILNGVIVNVTNPAHGASIPAGQFIVRGSVSSSNGGELGVTVNGFSAAVQGNTFSALIVVTPETTSITANATAANGVTASRTITITVSGAAVSPISLYATATSGLAPFTTTFSLFGDVETSEVALDANGDGSVDFIGASLDQIPYTYMQSGVYLATATVTDMQGTQTTVSAIIQVFDQSDLDSALRAKWVSFRDALARGDIEGALVFVANGAKDKYRGVFQNLAPDLPVIATNLREITPTLFQNSIAEYATMRDNGGQTFVYLVYFMRDEDGVWRIVTM